MTELTGSGDQFIEGDEYDTTSKCQCAGDKAAEVNQHELPKSADGFGRPEKCHQKGVLTLHTCFAKRQGLPPFRNVVQEDGDGDKNAELWAGQVAYADCNAFRKVVQGDTNSQ